MTQLLAQLLETATVAAGRDEASDAAGDAQK
jgi:hypothetical protein